MVAERIGRPVRPEIHCPRPVGRATAMPAKKNSWPMSWAGAGVTNTQEEEQGAGSSEPTPSGSPSAPPRIGEESPAAPRLSSASESSSPVTRRDLHRAKRGLIHVSEHLRDKLMKTKKALDEETERRQMEEPNLRKLLEDRMDMMVTAVHSAIDVLRQEFVEHDLRINGLIPLQEKVESMEGQLNFVAASAHEAIDHIKELEQRPQSD